MQTYPALLGIITVCLGKFYTRDVRFFLCFHFKPILPPLNYEYSYPCGAVTVQKKERLFKTLNLLFVASVDIVLVYPNNVTERVCSSCSVITRVLQCGFRTSRQSFRKKGRRYDRMINGVKIR